MRPALRLWRAELETAGEVLGGESGSRKFRIRSAETSAGPDESACSQAKIRVRDGLKRWSRRRLRAIVLEPFILLTNY